MKLDIKKDGYDLIIKYNTEKGHETHIWHFDKNGVYREKIIIVKKVKIESCEKEKIKCVKKK